MWQDLVSNKYISVEFNETVARAVSKLQKEKLVLVFKEKTFYGAVTKKNLLRIGVSLPEEKVSNISVKVPKVTLDSTNEELAQYFVQSGLPALVVYEKSKLKGIIERSVFLQEVIIKEIGTELVEDVTTKDVITIKSSDNLAKALSLFKEHNISKLVVQENGVKGVITLTNILNYFFKTGSAGKLNIKNLKSTLVKDVMKTDVYHVKNTDTIGKAINTFLRSNTSSLVVFGDNFFNKKNNLFGIVTKTDILMRYLATFKKSKININIASKIENLDENLVFAKLESLEKILPKKTNLLINLKKGKEKFRGMPLISCRIRVIMPGLTQNVSVEGWGLEHSLELAVAKLRRRLVEVDLF